MRLFDRSLSLVLSLLGITLLFLPKINLLSIGNKETAGIRVDDIILLGMGTIIAWAHCALNKQFGSIEKWMLAVVAFSCFSFSLNKLFVAEEWLHVNASLLYCLRLAEYFVFFYIGAMSSLFFRTSSIIQAFFTWNLALMFLQKFGWVGQFTTSGYVSDDTERVNGIGSFPSETGMFLVLVFCFLAFNKENMPWRSRLLPPDLLSFFYQSRIYWLFLLSTILVILSGSRIAIIALSVTFLAYLYHDVRSRQVGKWMMAVVFLASSALMATWLIYHTAAIFERSAGLLSMSNLNLIELVWNNIDISQDQSSHVTTKLADHDMSWWMRVHKWMFAAKTYLLHPECWLQGVGPGFAGTALDGGLLRILTEYGILGAFLFWKLFSTIAKQSAALKWMIIAFALNMIFFDVYLAYKAMSLLFFVSGATWASTLTRDCVQISLSLNPTSVNEGRINRHLYAFTEL